MKNTKIKFQVSLFTITVILLFCLSQACVPSKSIVTVQPDLNSSSSDPVSNLSDSSIPLDSSEPSYSSVPLDSSEPSDSSIPSDSSEPSYSSIPSDSSEPSDTPTTFTATIQIPQCTYTEYEISRNIQQTPFEGGNTFQPGIYSPDKDKYNITFSKTEIGPPNYALADPVHIDSTNFTVTTKDYLSVLKFEDTFDMSSYKSYNIKIMYCPIAIKDFDCSTYKVLSIEPLTSPTASPSPALRGGHYGCGFHLSISGLDQTTYTHLKITYQNKSN